MASASTVISGILNSLNSKIVAGTATNDEIVLQSKAVEQLSVVSENLDSTKVNLVGTEVDFNEGQVFHKTLNENTTLSFANAIIGSVKDLVIDGDYTLSFPVGTKIVVGTYDGTTDNLIQVVVTDTAEYWVSISQEQE